MIAEMARKSRLSKRSGGEKPTLYRVTGAAERDSFHCWEREILATADNSRKERRVNGSKTSTPPRVASSSTGASPRTDLRRPAIRPRQSPASG